MPYQNEDDYEEMRHPSYGMISVNRRQGGKDSLFGSSVQRHYSTIVITIKEGVRRHELSNDWYRGDKTICEVELTHAQFAEMITTPSVGDGVPCTIRYTRDGKFVRVEDPPHQVVEAEKICLNFGEGTKKFIKQIEKAKKEVEALLLGKKAPSKEARKQAVGILDRIIMELTSNEPFRVSQFNAAIEKVVVAAKGEIDGFVTRAIMATGLKELQRLQAALPGLQAALPETAGELPAHEEDD